MPTITTKVDPEAKPERPSDVTTIRLKTGASMIVSRGLRGIVDVAIGFRGNLATIQWGLTRANTVLVPARAGFAWGAICVDCGFLLLSPREVTLKGSISPTCPSCSAAALQGCDVPHTWGSCQCCPRRVDTEPEGC